MVVSTCTSSLWVNGMPCHVCRVSVVYVSLHLCLQVQKFTMLEKDFSMPGGELGEFLYT